MVKDIIIEKNSFGNNPEITTFQALEQEDKRRWLTNAELKRHENLEGRHLNITELKEGDYFGVGEDLRRTHIISLTLVDCLTIPRSVFEKANRLIFLDDLKNELEDAIPTDQQIVDEWLARKTWETYKKHNLADFYSKRKIADENERVYNMYRKWR